MQKEIHKKYIKFSNDNESNDFYNNEKSIVFFLKKIQKFFFKKIAKKTKYINGPSGLLIGENNPAYVIISELKHNPEQSINPTKRSNQRHQANCNFSKTMVQFFKPCGASRRIRTSNKHAKYSQAKK